MSVHRIDGPERRVPKPKLQATPAQNREASDFLAGYPPTATNDLARRGMLLASIGQLADCQPPLVDSDDLRLALLSERLGDVGAAYWRGMADIESELQKVAATALAWLEEIERSRAR